MKRNSSSFPGYPHLKRVAYNERYGRMELLEVQRTSDGFLIGMALIGECDEQYMHSVFLGCAPERSSAEKRQHWNKAVREAGQS